MKRILSLFFIFSINVSFAQFDSTLFNAKAKALITELSQYRLTSEYVGVGGNISTEYIIFLNILAQAPKDTLIYNLTKHKSSTVSGFGFTGLEKLNSPLYFKAFKEHSADTAQLSYLSGCVGRRMQMQDYLAVDSRYIIKNRKEFHLSRQQKRDMKKIRKQIIKRRRKESDYVNYNTSLTYGKNPIHWRLFNWTWRWIYFL